MSKFRGSVVRNPVPPKVVHANAGLFRVEFFLTFGLVWFHLLILLVSGSNWDLLWPYVIYARWHQCQITGYIELQ